MPYKTYYRSLATATLFVLVITLAATMSAVSADGEDDQVNLPEKTELTYPNLGSALDKLVASVEEGQATAQDAAEGASIFQGESVAVTIHLSDHVDEVVTFLKDNGGDPRNVGEDYIEAYVPVPLLGPVSQRPGVLRVREIVPPQATQTSQRIIGDGPALHGSQAWNRAGYSGQGVKVGVVDLGDFGGLTSLLGTELPATVVVRCYTDIGVFTNNLADCEPGDEEPAPVPGCPDPGPPGPGHGTTVAESLLDIAPGVSLYVANPPSPGDLQSTAEWMASQGVQVINHSVGWIFDGPGDGTSPHSDSPLNTVDRAVENDMIWVNAAGNDAQFTWFGSYSDPDGDGFINFASDVEVIDMPLRACRPYRVQLRWEDHWRGASSDLDLFLYDKSTNEFLLSSEDIQSGGSGHDPWETIRFTTRIASNDIGIVVKSYASEAPDWVQVVVWRAPLDPHTSNGSITNPAESANPGLLAVGAAPWYNVQTIEDFSGQGPAPDGRIKPEIVAADCGRTALTPLGADNEGFCGTSQAAPHVAGMAALVRQRFPSYTPAEVASYLKTGAAPRGDVPNNTWGHGFAWLPQDSPDRDALVALYRATGGDSWTNQANWLREDAPIALWQGVTTDINNRVTGLYLSDNQLTGEVPTELGSLANLESLSLWGNQLTGEIPTELGNLSNLEQLWLWGNQLTGPIPTELGNLANLQSLSLWGNRLTGEIPTELGNLANLEQLRLSQNQLTGPIPTELGGLANLQSLSLWGNRLTGEIPTELGNLANLEQLRLSQNQLTGPIPTELGGLANLQSLSLWGNRLTGEIPTELGNLANLQELYLSDNQLTGEILTELGNLANLQELYLDDNELTGEIPTELGNLANLQELYLDDNELTGEIPTELGNLANLQELYLSDNQLTGEILTELGGLANLQSLSLWGNRLTGEIPTELGNLANLQELYLSDNQLTGEILTELGGLANLQSLSLWGNRLTGEIPTELGNLANLQELYLSDNQLTGEIPTELGNLANLQELYLSDNQLTGEILTELGGLANLQSLSLWGNQLTGEIPTELGSLANLEQLRLHYNELSGVVPQTLAGLTMLEHFSFYNNLGLCAPIDDAFQTWLRGISILHGSSCAQADSPEDRAVLVEVHSTTDGVNWTNNANWLSGDLTRQWYGVTNDANGRVNGLFLGDNQLTGEIPPELGDLANLEELYLWGNELTGTIPAELGNLVNLEELDLADNQLTGEIPAELGRLTNLMLLRLSGNQLTGCVPASWQDVPDNDIAQLGLLFCTSQDALIVRYDDNNNGKIDRDEVLDGIEDFFDPDVEITRDEVLDLIELFFEGLLGS